MWAAPATPNTLRMITAQNGTVAWYTAASARTPLRMVLARSASVPMRKPGWSTRCTTGRWNVSHRSTKRVTFSDASAVQPAPYTYGSLASTPTGQPSRRANPVTAERPQRAPISSHEPRSTTASMMGRTL